MKRYIHESSIVIQTKDDEEEYNHDVYQPGLIHPLGHHQAIIECEGYGVKQEQIYRL